MKINSEHYDEIRGYLDTIPVIETHEHYSSITAHEEHFSFFFGYAGSDMQSAALDGFIDENAEMTFDERYDRFERLYGRTGKTAYARAISISLKECWGIDEISRESFRKLEDGLSTRSVELREALLEKFGIKAMIVDRYNVDEFLSLLEGKGEKPTRFCRYAFPLPAFHRLYTAGDINRLQPYTGRKIVCLDDYLEGFENLLKKSIDFGIVCMKDQSAYNRPIDYKYPARAEAEAIFNLIISDPRHMCGTLEMTILGDWLFHHFMRMARKYDLPVQIHTGHMAGIRNDIAKTNAVHFIPVMELHSEVRFDLFHGNWPYMDEFLFIGKNYPNAYLDLCWVQCIDPVYSIELMKRALVAVPHKKLMAFGGDCGCPETAIGYLVMARDNVACALSDMMDIGWIHMAEAKEIAADWFFNNPNEFFKLGFAPVP
jgi:hypothetical protein